MSQLGGEAQMSNTIADRASLLALQGKPDPAITISEGRQTRQSSSQDAGNPIAVKDSEKARIASSGAVARATIPPPSIFPEREPWSIASGYSPHSLDRAFKANLARLTFRLSPAVMAEQTFDWMAHLAISLGKQLELTEKWFRKSARLNLYAMESFAKPGVPPCIQPLPNDRRFSGEAWQRWPYNLIYQSFLLTQQWWDNATTGVDGVSQRNARSLSFTARQFLDLASPSNFILTNPEIAEVTLAQGGPSSRDFRI